MPECKLCQKTVESLDQNIEKVIMDMIKKSNPEWIETDGACPKCVEYYNGLDDMVEVL